VTRGTTLGELKSELQAKLGGKYPTSLSCQGKQLSCDDSLTVDEAGLKAYASISMLERAPLPGGMKDDDDYQRVEDKEADEKKSNKVEAS